MKSIANQSLPWEAELFSRLAPDSTQLGKCRRRGGEGEEGEGGRKENAGHWPNCRRVWYTWKKRIHADCITGVADRRCNSQALTMTSRDRPRDGEWDGAQANIFPLKEPAGRGAGLRRHFYRNEWARWGQGQEDGNDSSVMSCNLLAVFIAWELNLYFQGSYLYLLLLLFITP